MAVITIERSIASPLESTDNELFVCQFGEEACEPSHAFGPHVRDHILIHFVASGEGILQCEERTYSIGPGQGFLILPGEETYYRADDITPWHYAWVGYRGSEAETVTRTAGLDRMHRTFTVQDPAAVWESLRMMRDDARTLRLSQMAAVGNLLRFLSLIAPQQDTLTSVSPSRQHCEKLRWYLEGRYDQSVSIQEAADFVGLSRSHLYRVMMEEMGYSPQALLMHIRMHHAAQLLTSTTLNLEEIARRVGLQTGAQLGKAFRSQYGMTPGSYRKQHRT